MRVGEKHTFEPTIVPADAESPDLFWHNIKERDAHIASMEGNTVTALSPGTVTLAIAPVNQQNTLGVPDNTVIEHCELTVVSDDPASMRIDGVHDGQTFRIGDELDLSATMLAADAAAKAWIRRSPGTSPSRMYGSPTRTACWEQQPDGEALVIDDETGELTAVGTGVATITATARSRPRTARRSPRPSPSTSRARRSPASPRRSSSRPARPTPSSPRLNPPAKAPPSPGAR